MYIIFIDDFGEKEKGIDSGGLFKEYFTSLSKIVFNPNYGLFSVTETQLLYPNPNVKNILGLKSDYDVSLYFEFVGKILGKALYEEIVIQPQFPSFFLNKMLKNYCFINELPSLDYELHKNLLFLKEYQGDIQDLCLTFETSNDNNQNQNQIELLPGGKYMNVTSINKFKYINLMADYHLNIKGKFETNCFLKGFFEVIDFDWIKIFSPPELQILISGSLVNDIDINDLKKNCNLVGGFLPGDRTLNRFWNIVENEFTPKDRLQLLKFCTAAPRPPVLGFEHLNPRFTIRKIYIRKDSDKLPSASTCFNLLKLPTYSSSKILKQKLLYAIYETEGFGLS